MKKSVFFFRQIFLQAARRRQRREVDRAQVLVEYCLILAAIVLVCIGLIYALEQQTDALYSQIGSRVNAAGGS
jgi:Flp pilus assembly pilin Flp